MLLFAIHCKHRTIKFYNLLYKIEYTIAEDNDTVIVLYLVNTGVYLSSVVHYLNNAFTWDRWVVTRVCIVARARWALILEVTVYHRCQNVRGEKLVLVDLIRFNITLFQFNIKLDKKVIKTQPLHHTIDNVC